MLYLRAEIRFYGYNIIYVIKNGKKRFLGRFIVKRKIYRKLYNVASGYKSPELPI